MTEMENLSILSSDITKKMRALRKAPSGVLHSRKGSIQPIFVVKEEGLIRLHFFDPNSVETESRFDPANPLMLVSPYTQGMMLGLLWNHDPRNVHVLGLGGGRVPMILYHHFPRVQIDCTEIDRDVLDVAGEYFGLIADSRLRVVVQDGREYLQQRRGEPGYDLIMIDAFSGLGFGSFPLATREFLSLCASQLSEKGVVLTNVIADDFLLLRRVKTMISVFKNVTLLAIQNSCVLFGDNGAPLEPEERQRRAESIQQARQFAFPFLPHLQNMLSLPEILKFYPKLAGVEILEDAYPPVDLSLACPCGSGKKYKECHGRAR